MKVTDFIAEYLAKNGVHTVFGYQGGNIAHLIDSIGKRDDMKMVVTYNEQGASFSACGYALATGGLGVALASSGPGAINMISGIANAYYDSIPCVFITGNVTASSLKQKDEIRQNAFQENDIVSMVHKVTKYAVTVLDPEEIRYHLEKAVCLAKSGRPGPVLLDLPHNVQKAEVDFDTASGYTAENEESTCILDAIDHTVDCMKRSSRPVIVVGGGAGSDAVRGQLKTLLEIWKIPVVSTLRGLDVVAHSHDCYAGFGGAYGNRWANLALKYSDVMLVLGARLDERFLALGDRSLFEKKTVIHVDIDPIELGRVLKREISVMADVQLFLQTLLNSELPHFDAKQWRSVIGDWRNRYLSVPGGGEWCANNAISAITKEAPVNAVFTADVGINQMCTAQTAVIGESQRLFTSAGHGAMGCSLPMAIGAAFAKKSSPIICFVGDGGLHMNIQELLMLKKNRLNVHVVLINNQCLGMIRDFQTKAFDSRFVATVDEFQAVNYADMATAYQLDYCRVTSMEGIRNVSALLNAQGPCLIEVLFPENMDTNPRLGRDMFAQLPILEDQALEHIGKEAFACENIMSW